MRRPFAAPYFEQVSDPAQADVIIFIEDDDGYIRQSPFYAQYPTKCLVISGTDLPTFYLPAIYASNYRHLFSAHRTETYCYFSDERNPFIAQRKNAPVRKEVLLSFVGGATSWTRKVLFRFSDQLAAPDVVIRPSDDYQHWTNEDSYLPTKRERQKEYAELMGKSSFILCPRGAGHSSMRLFEAMEMGICPIILADGWIPPEGPDWKSCALFLPESQVKESVALARKFAASAETMGRQAREEYERFFSDESHSQRLHHLILKVTASRQPAREKVIHLVYPVYRGLKQIRAQLHGRFRRIVLWIFKTFGWTFPYRLNRPT